MAATARRVARILKAIHGEHFGGEQDAKFSITWAELRELAGGRPLTGELIAQIGAALREEDYVLVPLENSLVVAEEYEIDDGREVPGRVVDRYLGWEGEENGTDEEEIEDLEEGGGSQPSAWSSSTSPRSSPAPPSGRSNLTSAAPGRCSTGSPRTGCAPGRRRCGSFPEASRCGRRK